MQGSSRHAALAAGGLALLASVATLVLAAGDGPVTIRGFSAARAAAEKELEQNFQRIPTAESAEKQLRRLTAEPHMAGTEASHRVAKYLRDQFRSFGFEADLVTYSAWLPQPVEVKLELVEPEAKKLATAEQPFESDKDTYDQRAVVGFNAYSPSGDVTGPVVYVNYGMPEDYRELKELGVSVQGKVALARYGHSYRGAKAKLAEEHKAAALLIYSDPADDGYLVGEPYPRGPWRPMSGIQRGSILYTSEYPGDPLTPGVAATPQAQRIHPAEAQSLPHIPTMSLSAQDAEIILAHQGGARVPRGWQGGLPSPYHVGPGPAIVHLTLKMDYQERVLWDVIARLPGEKDDEWVVLGNHHDAWVFGAADPSSGTAVMLETARALGALTRSGWKPRRTIVMCEWDGEEFGLLGSTEWVEEHDAELQGKAVAYLNVDVGVSGDRFGGFATPSLKDLVRDATREVTDPDSGRSVYDAWKERIAQGDARRPSTPGRESEQMNGDVQLGALGAGSDFTPFFQHAGIPAMDLGFGGGYGVYHSLYDDFSWMQHFGDPSFAYHVAMARITGILALRLADADVLPFDYEVYGAEVERYVEEFEHTIHKGDAAKFDFEKVRGAAGQFRAAAGRAMKAVREFDGGPPDAVREEKINRELVTVEQALLDPRGLAGRPWFKHTLYAPGSYTGYSAVLLPGIREAVERRDWETARREAQAVAEALRRAAQRLDDVAQLASSAARTASAARGGRAASR